MALEKSFLANSTIKIIVKVIQNQVHSELQEGQCSE